MSASAACVQVICATFNWLPQVALLPFCRRLIGTGSHKPCATLALQVGPSGAAEAFGQSEALTTRLRHIIQDYPEGPGGHMFLKG